MIELLMPPELALSIVGLLLGVSFFASFITAAFGLGGGAVLLALMAILLPPAALIPVHGVVQLGSNLGRAGTMLRHVVWASLPAFTVGSLIGVALGGVLAVNFPPWMVQVGIGCFIIWSVLARPPRWMATNAGLTGTISSFLTMFFGATGVFVAVFTKSLGLSRHGLVSTHAALMTVQHGLKSVMFAVLGFAFAPWAGLIIGMILFGLLGTLAGRQVLNRLTDHRFMLALNGILLVTAARLIWAGLTGE
ncbi:sulfite exporter TauE/SafE family protein [Alkalilacustris brevis]|uniref:sulfite exporter TauE/SafE family protein n=1 Tax=Alkalilacustris brevis TaxID=2026338 RepID=UPI000E0D2CA4|nr:sulfite exporter TauE/SafE family protein [Alkalilacustris brevis]